MLCYLKGRHPLGCFSSERLEVNLTSAKVFFFFSRSNGAQYLMVNDGSYVMKPPNGHRNTYLHCFVIVIFYGFTIIIIYY